MLRVILAGCFLMNSVFSYSQNKSKNVAVYYSLGKMYYDNKDYLNAYKHLLAYKFLNLENLEKPGGKNAMSTLNEVVNYCEAQLRKGISESSTFNMRGAIQSNIDSINNIIKKRPPELPAKKIE